MEKTGSQMLAERNFTIVQFLRNNELPRTVYVPKHVHNLFVKLGVFPMENYSVLKEGIMDAPAKKPRVAKVPKKEEVARVYLSVDETKKLYRLMDRQGWTARFNQAKYLTDLVSVHATELTLSRSDEIVVDATDVRFPQVVVFRLPVKKPVVRKPRAPKTDSVTGKTAPAKKAAAKA
jgi:hypothetical protein